jgi:hypothetical protein
MTPFNPENKKTLTIGEALDPAMKIVYKWDAKQYKAAYVAYLEQFLTNGVDKNGMTAEQIANSNLGYYAGYYSNKVRERVETLFECAHPVFGSIAEKGAPTALEAFEMGKKIGEEATRRKK